MLKMKLFFLSIITIIVILYIDTGIYNYDLRFYYGKDDGAIMRIQSIILLSGFSFFVLSQKKRFKNLLVGLLVGFVSSILCWFFVAIPLYSLTHRSDTIFHFASCGLSIFVLFKLENRQNGK
jgi:hypothetical protein